MAKANLYDIGWQQGSLVRATLTFQIVDVIDGKLTVRENGHDLWLLATQDCDLAQTSVSNKTRNFELRPVYERKADDKIDGIRTRVISLTDKLVLRSDSPRLVISAQGLAALVEKREAPLSDEVRRNVKTWLGLRYDRPAIPTRFEVLNKKLEQHFETNFPNAFVGRIRDVLVYYESESAIKLFVIIRAANDRDEVLSWLDEVTFDLDKSAGATVIERQVEASSRTPLLVLETYYSLFAAEHSHSADGPTE